MRRWSAGVVALLLALSSCGPISEPDAPASISFDFLPSPAVVIGDTLRDEAGNVVPLQARVFDGRGRELEDAPVQFLVLNPGAAVTPEGFLVAQTDAVTTGIRIVASVGTLQSVARTLTVTRRPDVLEATADTIQIIEYDLVSPTNSDSLSVRVLSQDIGASAQPVPGWLVRYSVTGAAPTDTAPGVLVSEQNRLSVVDTTDATGAAARFYRVIPARITAAVDTIEVMASAQRLGSPLAGSPVRFLLILRPRGAS